MLGAVDIYEMGYSDKVVMVKNLVRGYDLVVKMQSGDRSRIAKHDVSFE